LFLKSTPIPSETGPVKTSTPLTLFQRKAEGGLEKGLANLWRRKSITKKVHAVVVSMKLNGKSQLKAN
jgi:hypothetical protein